MRAFLSVCVVVCLVVCGVAMVALGNGGSYGTPGYTPHDVNLATLGQDITPGEFWTPDVDFSDGTKYYFDPSAAPGGDGSIGDPFQAFGAAVDAGGIISQYHYNGSVLSAGVVQPGDVCVLREGNHGWIFLKFYWATVQELYYGIVAMPGEDVRFDAFELRRGSYWYLEGLRSSERPRHEWARANLTAADSLDNYDGAPSLIIARDDTTGSGDVRHFIVKDCLLRSVAPAVAATWDSAGWNRGSVNGIRVDDSFNIHLQGNTLECVNYAFDLPRNEDVTLINNHVRYLNGDGAKCGTATDYEITQNTFRDWRVTNNNHVDLLQFFYESFRTSVTRNYIVSNTDITEPLAGSMNGVLYSSGPSNDAEVSNNVIIAGDWGGIKIMDGDGSTIRNNTVVPIYSNGAEPDWGGAPLISFDTSSGGTTTDCTAVDNICTQVSVVAGATKSGNLEYTDWDMTPAGFVSWAPDVGPVGFDLRLTPTSPARNVGTDRAPPTVDANGATRPRETYADIGAYEYTPPREQIDAAAVGADLKAGRNWNPDIDFSDADVYYFDPEATAKGDGSLGAPFRSLSVEADSDSTIEKRDYATNAVTNAVNGPVVGPGDLCVLLGGNHEDISFSNYFNRDWVGVTPMPGHDVRFDSLQLYRGHYFYFEGLKSTRRYRSAWPTPGTGYDDAPTFVGVYGHSTYDAHHVVIKDFDIASTADWSGWSVSDWADRAPNGLKSQYMRKLFVQDNTFYGVNFGVHNIDSAITEVVGNRIDGICADGMITEADTLSISQNYLANFFDVSTNHNDLIQGYTSSGLTEISVDRNYIIRRVATDDDELGDLNGINFTGGPWERVYLTNNVVIAGRLYYGLQLNGAVTDCRIANNTAVPIYAYSGTHYGPRVIMDGDAIRCYALNNICRETDLSATGVTDGGNVEYGDPPPTGFVNYEVGTDPSLFNMIPISDTYIGKGVRAYAPETDYTGRYWETGPVIDVGAYENRGEAADVAPDPEPGSSNITSVTGEMSDGESVIIAGVGFGSKGTAAPHSYDSFQGGATLKQHVSEMYFDTTRARVEVGDATVFEDCTHREIQLPTSWTDAQITFDTNLGTFADAETAYVFVVNSGGDVTDGYEITIGE